MSNVKEIERAELHKTIWRIANDLRGSVDGWDFKSYVLGMLFYRFISENLTAYLNLQERSAGDKDFDYATLPDADAEQGLAAAGGQPQAHIGRARQGFERAIVRAIATEALGLFGRAGHGIIGVLRPGDACLFKEASEDSEGVGLVVLEFHWSPLSAAL